MDNSTPSTPIPGDENTLSGNPAKRIVTKIKQVGSDLTAPKLIENSDDENVILQRLKKETAADARKRKAELAEKLQKTRTKTIAIDIVSGLFAAVAVAPGIAIVDQAVTEKTADKNVNLFKSAFSNLKSLFTSPIKFVTKPTFMFVCFVYGMTYVAANCITSLCAFNQKDPFLYKLGGTTAVNMTLGVLKDRYFAQKFSGGPVKKFPAISWSLFIIRDSMTIGAGFSLPPLVSSLLYKKKIVHKKSTADKVSQLLTPMAAQFVLTPVHILALDFYNNKVSTWGSRLKVISSIYVEATVIRFGRVLCAYGIAGIFNVNLRNQLRSQFLDPVAIRQSTGGKLCK